MNKTLLLIMCDFLLLNLLALTRWEQAVPQQITTPAPPAATGSVDPAKATQNDLVSLMQVSLQEEQNAKSHLSEELAATRNDLSSTQKDLAQANASVADREQAVATLTAQQASLNADLSQTRQQAATLNANLEDAKKQAAASKDRLDQLQSDLEKREAEAKQREAALAQLQQEHAAAQSRIQELNTTVQVVTKEKDMLADTADTLRTQVEAERAERAKVQETATQLAAGVGQLAEHSADLAQEIRENRPVSVNAFFKELMDNRVHTVFSATRDGLFGSVDVPAESDTVFVSDGKNVFAIMHLRDTPFPSYNLTQPTWKSLQVEFSRARNRVKVSEVRFLSLDPRVVALPVNTDQAAALGVKVYNVALEPFKFPEAILVNAGGKGYGEVAFKLDSQQPGYVKMDNRLFKHVVGDFTPSTGDLVFSKTGEFLGIMVTSDFCAVVNNFLPTQVVPTGTNLELVNPTVSSRFDALVARYKAMPFRLQ